LSDSGTPRIPGRFNGRGMFKIRRWHKHSWSEWDRSWGKGSPKAYVLERKCVICGKLQTKVIR